MPPPFIMSEFKQGIFKVIAGTSAGRATIYTFGHIIISMAVVRIVTGASWSEAGIVALIEPILNGFWYYLLDKTITRFVR